MPKANVTGFGKTSMNGLYNQVGVFNGKAFYSKDANTHLVYKLKNGPYSFLGSYYLTKTYQIQGSIPINKPIYSVEGDDPTASSWQSLLDQRSAENTVGSITII